MGLDFPRHVHKPVSRAAWDAGVRDFRVVANAVECDDALADGYALTPVIVEDVAPGADIPDIPVHVPEIPDIPLDTPKRKPGRPRKQDEQP